MYKRYVVPKEADFEISIWLQNPEREDFETGVLAWENTNPRSRPLSSSLLRIAWKRASYALKTHGIACK